MNYKTTSTMWTLGFCFLALVYWFHLRSGADQAKTGAYAASGGAGQTIRKVPFEIFGNVVLLKVRVNGSEPLSFILDTGSDATLLNSDQAERLGLPLKKLIGADAPPNIRAAKVSLSLPGLDLDDQIILVRISAPPSPVHSGGKLHGVLGYNFFNQFVVEIDYVSKVLTLYDPKTFQYAQKRMILEPNKHLREPFEYDMSGAWLLYDLPNSSGFKVASVLDKTPAAEAGLREGDVIVAINGEPAEKFTLPQVTLAMFRQAGRSYDLKVRRGDQMTLVKISLRRLI